MAFSAALIMRDVLEDNAVARRDFMEKHGTKARRIGERLGAFYERFGTVSERWKDTPRNKIVGTFLHAAGNSLVQSTNLLVVSMLAPSGNMMRQFAESVAMTLLCATPKANTLEPYLRDRLHFPVQKAINSLSKPKIGKELTAYLGFEPAGWATFHRAIDFFDIHSHANVVTIGANQLFGKKNRALIVGSAYDVKKFGLYRDELKHRLGAVGNLLDILTRIDQVVDKQQSGHAA